MAVTKEEAKKASKKKTEVKPESPAKKGAKKPEKKADVKPDSSAKKVAAKKSDSSAKKVAAKKSAKKTPGATGKPLKIKKPTTTKQKKKPVVKPTVKKTKRPLGKNELKKLLRAGSLRFGRSKRAALDKVLKRTTKKPLEGEEKKKEKKNPQFVIKPIGGEKNGGTRKVILNKFKSPKSYTNQIVKRKHPKDVHNKKSIQHLRPSLKKGVVCIVLAGLHKGKRVVFLKQLPSGMCLVTGPYLINGCPLRRVNQNYLIGTSTTLRLNRLNIPSRLNDAYFKRIKLNKKAKKEDADIFEKKKEKFTTSKKRYTTQVLVDKPVISAIKRHPDARMLKRYLHTKFLLSNKQYPHSMKF